MSKGKQVKFTMKRKPFQLLAFDYDREDGVRYRLDRHTDTHIAVYTYQDVDLGMRTDLFSEIGAPYQPWFEEQLRALHYTRETVERDEDVYDVLTHESEVNSK